MNLKYQNGKCAGKRNVFCLKGIIIYGAVSIIYPYLLLALPIAYLIQLTIPKILQKEKMWECELIFIFTSFILLILIMSLNHMNMV